MKEAKCHLKSTLFIYNLETSQKEQFASICHRMASTFYSSVSNNHSNPSTPPPISLIDIDQYYLNISTSIANNIHITNAIESHEHACLSIKDAIQHYLCFETNTDDGMLIEKATKNFKNIISASSQMCQESSYYI